MPSESPWAARGPFRQALLAVASGAVALVLGGCGGEKGGGSASAAGFRREADAICTKYEQKLEALGPPSSLEGLPEFVDRAIPIIEMGNDELRSLEAPDEFADDWGRIMKLQETNLQTTRDLQKALRDDDAARAQDLVAQLGSTEEESTRLAQKLGLEHCGQDD